MDPRERAEAGAPERLALPNDGERALQRGDTAATRKAFDAAAQMLHAADTEMGPVRGGLQAGEYRQALAFCAHTAGAHREGVLPVVLYAWLLRAGAQPAIGQSVLDDALKQAPLDEVALEVQRQSRVGRSNPTRLLLAACCARSDGAIALGEKVRSNAQVIGSGVLIAAGRASLVPLAMVAGAQHIWLRNGLGQTAAAALQRALPDFGLAYLRLTTLIAVGALTDATPRAPFAGSPGFVASFTTTREAEPAWPLLSAGFLGGLDSKTNVRHLGIEVASAPNGGPVFDAHVHLAGIALRDDLGSDRLLPLVSLRAPMSVDEAYERALRVALQVIVVP